MNKNSLTERLRLMALLAMTLLAAACGGDDDGGSVSGGDDDGNGSATVQNTNANRLGDETDKAVRRLEFPNIDGANSSTSVVIVHRTTTTKYDPDGVNFAVQWDYEKKSQRWTCYQMHKGYTGNLGRFDGGYPDDPQLPATYRLDQDYYWGSGYQHGHICPNADRLFDEEARNQTYYMTNMQPQYPCFNGYQGSNQGLWLRMEGKIRDWVPYSASDTLYVCKGGTIDSEDNIIERVKGKLIVPKYFFMAVLWKKGKGVSANAGDYEAIAFFAEQKNQWATNDDLTQYVVSIDRLEELTGIDFFCNLPDNIEQKVEKTVALSQWGKLE